MDNRKVYIKAEYLPSLLVKKLRDTVFDNSRYYPSTKNNFLLCVSAIYYHQVKRGIGIENFVPLGSNYWKTVFGGNYHERVINPLLLEHEIIESHDFGYRSYPNIDSNPHRGKQDGKVGIRYRIKPEMLNDQFEHIHYIPKDRVCTAEELDLAYGEEFIASEISDKNFRISIDQRKAIDWVETNAERICQEMLNRDFINTFPDSLIIECRELVNVSEGWTFDVKYRSVASAKLIAETRWKEMFYFNGDFYIANIEVFLNQRIKLLKYSYKQHILKIGLNTIAEKQNPLTLRIYSDLTNFPSRILQFININNTTVVQLDLRTSQFLLFSNLLNTYLKYGQQGLLKPFREVRTRTYLRKLAGILNQHQSLLPKVGVNINDSSSGQYSNSDVTKYIRDVFFADFYNVIQQELGLNNRLLAKHTLFKLLFKKTNRPDALLSKLSQRYPVVMSIIAEFKKQPDIEKQNTKVRGKDDYESNFSVFLSCVEGEIFVNNILYQLREAGIPCFTRHDSVVVASGYEELAETIAKRVFNEFGFKYNHRVEDKFWEVVDEDELESSDYIQWLIDENELNQDFDFGETPEEPIDNEPENNYDMDEQELETLEKLKEIGIRDDYYDYVDAEFLEELVLLPILNEQQQNILYDDINNLHDGMSFLQDSTNDIIREIINRIS